MAAFRSGPFLLDTSRRLLLRDGAPVELPPKAFDLIAYLVTHRDRAVGRDEVISAVWGRIDVSDNVLDQIVLRARKALGDVEEPRRYIATRPRFGFAWVAGVDVVDAPVAVEPPDVAAPTPQESRPAPGRTPAYRRLVAIVVLAVAVAVATVAVPWWRSEPAPVAARDALLVLPLEVASDADAAWARLGLMDLVAQRLRDGGFDTLPADHAVALLRAGATPPADDAGLRALGARAGADWLVSGHVALRTGRWQVRLRALGPPPATAEARGESTDPLDAARIASDALASALGRAPPGIALPGDPVLALALQQIDAAVMGDDLERAQRLLDAMTPAQRDEPAARLRAASLHFRRGALDDAERGFDALLAQVSASDDPRLRGTVLNASGNLALRRGDAAGAERRADEAIALLEPLAPSRELGRAWTGRAIARSTLRRHDEALADFARARVVLDGVGDRLGVARVDINVGILDGHRGRYAEAVPVLVAAADRLAAFNDLTNELYARVALARARLGLLEAAGALPDAQRLEELAAREPNPERRRYADLARAEVLFANGRLGDASSALQGVRESAGADADVVLLGWAQAIAAREALATDPARAAREAEASLNAPWEDEGARFFADAWLTLVLARLATEPAGEAAAAALQGFEHWAERVQDPSIVPALALARASVAATRAPDAGTDAYAKATAAAEASRIPADLLRATRRHAAWLLSRGDAGAASAVAGRATAWADRDFEAALLSARVQAALGHPEAAQAALDQARRLAGERPVPTLGALATP